MTPAPVRKVLRIARLSIGRDATRGHATLQWRAAGSGFSPLSPLGDYEFRFAGNGAEVAITLHTLAGPLQLEGRGSWRHGQRPLFLAIARVPTELQQRLAPFLRLIAAQRGDGSFELQLK
jgi:general secretion pathway protein N